ncbi:hypothetical protein [Luteimonas arsenica]|uniref:hypothetical protein n=1 Tax=Luteimonas arsenica TaxID=1586242 RepID=UPI001055CDE6|nr:hypothetical protein [Luteimonas arsenica]
MSPKQEECILDGLLKAMDTAGKKRSGWRFWLISAVLWLATASLFFVVFRYGGSLQWPHYLLAAGSFALGLGFAYDFYKSISHQQWPVMARYVDREQVERRLAELRT